MFEQKVEIHMQGLNQPPLILQIQKITNAGAPQLNQQEHEDTDEDSEIEVKFESKYLEDPDQ